jgi:hypothetical protein
VAGGEGAEGDESVPGEGNSGGISVAYEATNHSPFYLHYLFYESTKRPMPHILIQYANRKSSRLFPSSLVVFKYSSRSWERDENNPLNWG